MYSPACVGAFPRISGAASGEFPFCRLVSAWSNVGLLETLFLYMQILLSPAILRSDMPTWGEFILGTLVSNPGSEKVVIVGEGVVVLFIFQMK